MVQLAQWGSFIGLNDAVSVLLTEDFDPETAEMSDSAVRTVLMFGETIATLTKNDLLSTELVYDWLWVAGLWDAVGPAAIKARERHQEPRLYENFEALARGA